MTWWKPNTWRRKSVTFSDVLSLMWASVDSGLTPTYQSLAQEGYQGNPDVFGVIRSITVPCRGIPLIVYKPTKDGKIEPVDPSHPLQTLLRRPNPWTSGSAFMEAATAYHLLTGKAYVYRIGPLDTRRPPRELHLLRPDAVENKHGTAPGEITSYEYTAQDAKPVTYQREEVLYLPFFNPLSAWDGMSPLQPASRGVDIGNAGRTWNYNLIHQGARPSGILTTDQGLTPDQRDQLDQVVRTQFAGELKAGNIPILEAGLTWLNLGYSPAEMEWGKLLQMSTLDICKVYNVAPEIVGDSANKTYSNYQEARQSLYTETVLPLLDYICDELNNWLTPLYGGGLIIGYDRSKIEALQEDADRKWTRLNASWELTPNERRAEKGFDKSDDPAMDKVYVPSNLVPLEMLSIDDTGADEVPTGGTV